MSFISLCLHGVSIVTKTLRCELHEVIRQNLQEMTKLVMET